jgi:hypothetical protein
MRALLVLAAILRGECARIPDGVGAVGGLDASGLICAGHDR